MAPLAPDSDEAKRIDAALREWRQGDLALDESWFVHVGDGARPLTDAASDAPDDGIQAFTSEVMGLVVVTQTCDIVRSCARRPYVELGFWFIRDAGDRTFEGKSWADLLEGWLALVAEAGRFRPVEGQVLTLCDMTAEDYVESDPLDLDHLSTTTG